MLCLLPGAQDHCILRHLILEEAEGNIRDVMYSDNYPDIGSAYGIVRFQASGGETFRKNLLDLFGTSLDVFDSESSKRKAITTALGRFGIKPVVGKGETEAHKWTRAYNVETPFEGGKKKESEAARRKREGETKKRAVPNRKAKETTAARKK